jgi:hypothetical protein
VLFTVDLAGLTFVAAGVEWPTIESMIKFDIEKMIERSNNEVRL